MSIVSQTRVPTTSPSIQDQSITTTFHVEVMHDLDTGEPTLVGSSDANHGDLQVVTADQVIAKAQEQHRLVSKAVKLALDYEAATKQTPAAPHRSWIVADRTTGMPLKGTCLPGCHGLHFEMRGGTADANDIQCTDFDQANSTELPIGCGSEDGQEWTTLSVLIQSYPVHPDEAKRVPLAAIEVTEDHYIEDLDPNGLATVIDKLQQRVDAMRVRHAELIRARAEYFGRQA
ncbi:DUF6907 domain-containing protein [Streptomyces pseudovenezuelae]|uniref:DUF6907 domain-containing protein n=1 Tax=Streptomyces pseudovenezuelae TaxID=67350 RepID=UPI002E35E259|nr:hypothetical protein [Streptomyces pseudovenezuelae]